MNQRTILVTGANGFIGRHLVPLLIEHGWDVHATSLESSMEGVAPEQYHQADLLIPGEARRIISDIKPQNLLHLAWFVAPGLWMDAPQNLDWVRASLEIAREFVDSGGKRLLVSGSCLEYDWNFGYCSELRTPCVPHTLYGTAKNALRLMLDSFMPKSGCSFAWGRIFFLYGPYEHPDRLVPAIVRALLQGEPARCSHGRQIRDYLYVEDVARAFLALIESKVEGALNIASGQPIALRCIVKRIASMIGKPELLQVGAIPPARTDTPLVVGDTALLSERLGWQPSFSLDEGLGRTIDWWRRNLRSRKVQNR
jgi:nucleoside-diphosphate-sugar epimerase